MCVQAVALLHGVFHLHGDREGTRDVRPVAVSPLPVIDTAHVHDAMVNSPAQQAVGQGREEARVTGQCVGGEDVGVRSAGHGEVI